MEKIVRIFTLLFVGACGFWVTTSICNQYAARATALVEGVEYRAIYKGDKPVYDYTQYNKNELMRCLDLADVRIREINQEDEVDVNILAKWQITSHNCYKAYRALPEYDENESRPQPMGRYNKVIDTFEFTNKESFDWHDPNEFIDMRIYDVGCSH